MEKPNRDGRVSPQLILASTSKWRLHLLHEAGVLCQAVDPKVDESSLFGGNPEETATLRARCKAESVHALHPEALVIGADQVVHLDGQIYGKPVDTAHWLDRLKKLRGRTHKLTTAMALTDRSGTTLHTVTTLVHFRSDLSDEELENYVALGEAAGCAGGYMVERRGAWLVEWIEGDWLNVIGIPVLDLIGLLRARGWRLD